MAQYKNPYLTQKVYNPQRSGVTGMRSLLPENLYLNTTPGVRLPEYTGARTGRDVAQALGYEDVGVPDSGPGGDLGQAQGMPNSVESGVLSQDQADAVSNVATGLVKGMVPLGFPANLIMKGMVDLATGDATNFGMPSVADTEGIKGDIQGIDFGFNVAPTAQESPQSGMSAVMKGAFDESPPVSPMADMDFGGGMFGGGGGLFGGGESPDAGVAAGIAVGFGGDE